MSSKSLNELFADYQATFTRAIELRKAAGLEYERYPGPLYEIDGIWMMSGAYPRKAVEQLSQLEPRPGDVMISTYPRSGTTWVSAMLYLIHNQADLDDKIFAHDEGVPYLERQGRGKSTPGIERIKDIPSPRLMVSHLPITYFQKQLESGKFKVIVCTRDPRDVAVSYYHFHQLMMANCYGGSFADFFQLFRAGKVAFGECFTHTKQGLLAAQKFPQTLMVLRYEDIHKNHGSVVKQIAEFCGIDITDDKVEKIVQRTKFSSLKNNKMANPNYELRSTTKVSENQFVRKGLVGEWQESYFTPEMLLELKEVNEDKMGKFASYFDI